MHCFDDVIQSYVAADLEPGIVAAWHLKHSPSDEALSTLAECIGAKFLAGQLNFVAANGLLNDLMPLVGGIIQVSAPCPSSWSSQWPHCSPSRP